MFHVKPIIELESESKKGKIKIMGFKMPIVCKELYLPIPRHDENLSLLQYKEKYGIDLTPFIDVGIINDKGLAFKAPKNTKIYLVAPENFAEDYDGNLPLVSAPNNYTMQGYDPDNTADAVLDIEFCKADGSIYYALDISISYQEEFKAENIKITSNSDV